MKTLVPGLGSLARHSECSVERLCGCMSKVLVHRPRHTHTLPSQLEYLLIPTVPASAGIWSTTRTSLVEAQTTKCMVYLVCNYL